MLSILRAYGVPEKLVTAIGHTYDHTIARVTSPDGVTDDFDIQTSRFLFVFVFDLHLFDLIPKYLLVDLFIFSTQGVLS